MANVVGIHFEDFKKLVKNHRVYYFKGDGYYDFHFLSDGMIVKSTVLENQISNPTQFFADKIFYGSLQLTFPIVEEKPDLITDVEGIKKPLDSPITFENSEPIEVKKVDIQREGVDAENPGVNSNV